MQSRTPFGPASVICATRGCACASVVSPERSHTEPALFPSEAAEPVRPGHDGHRAPRRRAVFAIEATDGSLEEALRLARQGDEEGFAELWRSLHPPLLRYLTVRGNDAVEDIAAETWLQVSRDLGRFKGGIDDFRAWLFTIARNRAIDQGRARAARPSVSVPEIRDVTDQDAEASMPSAETAALERVSTEKALAMVASLPREQAEMVMLRVVAGLDVAAVAKIVGKRPGTVRVAVHRALKTLAQRPDLRAAQDDEHEVTS